MRAPATSGVRHGHKLRRHDLVSLFEHFDKIARLRRIVRREESVRNALKSSCARVLLENERADALTFLSRRPVRPMR